jgi:hypothetical protein
LGEELSLTDKSSPSPGPFGAEIEGELWCVLKPPVPGDAESMLTDVFVMLLLLSIGIEALLRECSEDAQGMLRECSEHLPGVPA